jgi:hypothetical protein
MRITPYAPFADHLPAATLEDPPQDLSAHPLVAGMDVGFATLSTLIAARVVPGVGAVVVWAGSAHRQRWATWAPWALAQLPARPTLIGLEPAAFAARPTGTPPPARTLAHIGHAPIACGTPPRHRVQQIAASLAAPPGAHTLRLTTTTPQLTSALRDARLRAHASSGVSWSPAWAAHFIDALAYCLAASVQHRASQAIPRLRLTHAVDSG